MAFNGANLMLMGQAIGGPIRDWAYLTLDSTDAVAAPGYFPPTSLVQIGDWVDLTIVDDLVPESRTTAETVSLIIKAF